MAGREQEGRRLVAAEQVCQPALGRVLAQNGLHLPGRLTFLEWRRQRIAEGLDEHGRAEPGRLVIRVAHAEQDGASGEGDLPLLGGHHAAGISGVLFERVEPDTADGILDVELVLEGERDRLRVADDQQVVRHLLGIGLPGPHPLPGQEIQVRVVGSITLVSTEFVVVFPGLGLPPLHQLLEGVLDRRVGFTMEEDAPAGLLELARVDPRPHPEVRLGRFVPAFNSLRCLAPAFPPEMTWASSVSGFPGRFLSVYRPRAASNSASGSMGGVRYWPVAPLRPLKTHTLDSSTAGAIWRFPVSEPGSKRPNQRRGGVVIPPGLALRGGPPRPLSLSRAACNSSPSSG